MTISDTSSTQPSDLYNQLQDALEAHRNTRRALTDLAREYALLDPAELDVDTLGEPTTAAHELELTRAGLRDLLASSYDVDDTFDRVLGPASRLLRPRP
ncbi:hypothetical protein [Prescottella subtropica]|uniref:hypothetical protein n=1 Tax=Prescottella subtropica TaxID=2545757 RepID=UPI0010F6B566|nr:hypothetical protein [Prescottella subtropica]